MWYAHISVNLHLYTLFHYSFEKINELDNKVCKAQFARDSWYGPMCICRRFRLDVGHGNVGIKTYCKFPEPSGTRLMNTHNLNHTIVKELFEGSDARCGKTSPNMATGTQARSVVCYKRLSKLSQDIIYQFISKWVAIILSCEIICAIWHILMHKGLKWQFFNLQLACCRQLCCTRLYSIQ